MTRTRIAIAVIAAAGLVAPVSAWQNKTAQTDQTTQSATMNHSSSTKEAMSDSAITSKIKAEMAKEKGVSATHIHVKTVDGVVTLTGTARNVDEADRAASIAHNTKGVTSVNNDLHVASAR
jgi:hyperosmotically inducible protein